MHVSSRFSDERRLTALLLAGTYGTSVRSLVKPKAEECTCLCFPLRYNSGISGLCYNLKISTDKTKIMAFKRKQ
jgi:hypothetical protein